MTVDIKDVERIQKVIAFTEKTKDLLDEIDYEPLKEKYKHIYNSCRTFNNRMNNKKAARLDKFLDALFVTEESGLEFNNYIEEINETISFILNLKPIDYYKLKAFREFNFNDNYILATKKELRNLVYDAKLNPDNADKILDKWLKKT